MLLNLSCHGIVSVKAGGGVGPDSGGGGGEGGDSGGARVLRPMASH